MDDNDLVGALAPAPAATVAPELRLETPDTPTGQAGVAALYEVHVRKVKRWVAAGREAQDPPPLHSPCDMRAWHDRLRERGIFKQRCGPEFDRAAAKLAAGKSPARAPAPARAPSAAPGPASDAPDAGAMANIPPTSLENVPDLAELNIDLDDFDPGSIDFDDGVSAAKLNFKFQADALRRAFLGTDENERRRARVAFKEALDLYREVERDREKIMAASGRLLKRDIVRREMLALHGNIAGHFKSRMKEALIDIATAVQNRATWGAFCDRFVDGVCRILIETRFAAPDNQSPAPLATAA